MTSQLLQYSHYLLVFTVVSKKKKKTSPKIPFVRLSRTRRCGTFSICIIMFRLCRMIPRPDNRLARGSRRRRACVIARASEYCDIKINMQTPRVVASRDHARVKTAALFSSLFPRCASLVRCASVFTPAAAAPLLVFHFRSVRRR